MRHTTHQSLSRTIEKLKSIFAIAAIAISATAHAAEPTANVVIEEDSRQYTIQSKNGVMTGAKSRETATYHALRADDEAEAMTFYDDAVTIDKASAPGATPLYRTWESKFIFYGGERICYMRIPLKRGAKAKAVFEQTYKKPEEFCAINLAPMYFTRHLSAIIKVPADLSDKIYVKPHGFPPNMSLSEERLPNGSVEYRIEGKDLEELKPEDGAPKVSATGPILFIGGHFDSVESLYRHLHQYIPEESAPSAEIAELAADLRSRAGNNPLAITDTTIAWVQRNIRYLAIEHGEYGVRPAPAADVLTHKAGDCKGSANLTKALLKQNGIDSRLAWIGTKGSVGTTWEELPAVCSGNHMIAAAIIGDSIIYLDGTASFSPAGYVHPAIRGQQALIENGDTPIIATVPSTSHSADTDTLFASYKIDGQDLTGSIERRAYGVTRMWLLSTLARMEPKDKPPFLAKYLRYPKQNLSVASSNIYAPDHMPAATISAAVTERGSARRMGDQIFIDLKPIRSMLADVIPTKDRTRDYAIDATSTTAYIYNLELPEGYVPKTLPAPFSIDSKWVRAEIVYSFDNGILTCHATLEPKAEYIPLCDIEARNADFRAVFRASDSQIAIIPEKL